MGLKIDFLFYCRDLELVLALDPTESLHAVKVLRKKTGDKIQVTDGKGGWFSCIITDAHPKHCRLQIQEAIYNFEAPQREIYVAISPTKSGDRIEYFLEKSIEIGVSGIIPIKTTHTYPKNINAERWQKIAISAMKQSLKAYLPEIYPYQNFATFLEGASAWEARYLAHLSPGARDIMEVPLAPKTLIWIGPEGDFTEEEIILAKNAGFENITLGKSRLRTETAGVFAVSILNAR
jgi:16S rRNA (uracil1498-N3)-methyltransferase